MASPTNFQIRQARLDEIDDAADALADAFADYPWTRFTVAADDHLRRVRGLQRLALELLGFDHGEMWAATVGDQMAGAVAFTDSRAPAPESVVRELHERSIELIGDRLDASVEAHAAAGALVPNSPHLSLDVVGVRRSWQGRGIGGALIAPGLADADRMGLPVRLETSTADNVAFYESHGFAVSDHVEIPDGPSIWAMLRPPR